MVASVVFVLYAAWFLLTIAFQFPNVISRVLARIDVFALFPIWTFFAPTPSRNDFHLLSRDRLEGGEVTSFLELDRCALDRGRFAPWWFPRRRYTKTIQDAMAELARCSAMFRPHELVFTTCYLTLANFVAGQPRQAGALSRQFIIVMTHGYAAGADPLLTFASSFHTLEGG